MARVWAAPLLGALALLPTSCWAFLCGLPHLGPGEGRCGGGLVVAAGAGAEPILSIVQRKQYEVEQLLKQHR
jgi:hypothetical protein